MVVHDDEIDSSIVLILTSSHLPDVAKQQSEVERAVVERFLKHFVLGRHGLGCCF